MALKEWRGLKLSLVRVKQIGINKIDGVYRLV